MKNIEYNCTGNYNSIKINYSNDEYANISFGTPLKSEGMVVIGIYELKNALNQAGLDIVEKINITID